MSLIQRQQAMPSLAVLLRSFWSLTACCRIYRNKLLHSKMLSVMDALAARSQLQNLVHSHPCQQKRKLKGSCHCEPDRAKQSPPLLGDCFVAKTAPRNTCACTQCRCDMLNLCP